MIGKLNINEKWIVIVFIILPSNVPLTHLLLATCQFGPTQYDSFTSNLGERLFSTLPALEAFVSCPSCFFFFSDLLCFEFSSLCAAATKISRLASESCWLKWFLIGWLYATVLSPLLIGLVFLCFDHVGKRFWQLIAGLQYLLSQLYSRNVFLTLCLKTQTKFRLEGRRSG